jgi:hypothetical protein
MTSATSNSGAPAASADARPVLGYFLTEADHARLLRAAAAAGLLAAFAEYAELTGESVQLSPHALGALGEYLHTDLRDTLAACAFGRWHGKVLPHA